MQARALTPESSTGRETPLSRRLALQQRVAAKPVAVNQQIKREMQTQVNAALTYGYTMCSKEAATAT